MASIRRRGDTWQARVSRQGFPPETKSFPTKGEADRWSRIVEGSMDSRQYISTREAETTTLGDLLRRYRESVTPSKRGAIEEAFRLKSLEQSRMARLAVVNVTPKTVADYRDDRLKGCCAGTVIRDLAVLSSIFNHARREWDIGVPNPVATVRKPTAPPGRDRVLTSQHEGPLPHPQCRTDAFVAAALPHRRQGHTIEPGGRSNAPFVATRLLRHEHGCPCRRSSHAEKSSQSGVVLFGPAGISSKSRQKHSRGA